VDASFINLTADSDEDFPEFMVTTDILKNALLYEEEELYDTWLANCHLIHMWCLKKWKIDICS
jgi:hypothetical protein